MTITNHQSPISFKRDHHQRAALFHPDSFKHQGRANLNLLSALLQYAPAGQIVLDPMGGTGSILLALDYQHPVLTRELESHWALVAEMNRKSISRGRLIAFSSPAVCCQWNANRLPLADSSIPCIITSPPYWDMLSDWHIKSKGLQDAHEVYGPAYGTHPDNLGNVHIYEDYLRAMAQVYRECHRVLGPGQKLVLILKDRVHKFNRVPLVTDTIGLCTALGFSLIDTVERKVNPSLHRRVNQLHYPEAATVDTETALVFAKTIKQPGPPVKFALVQAPKPDSAPSWQLFAKQLAYGRQAERLLVLANGGLTTLEQGKTPVHTKFSRRKEFSFAAVQDLVTKFGFAAGDILEFHGSMAYGQYLQERITTFGGQFTNPTEGLNLGQKLAWYTNCDLPRTSHTGGES